MKIFVLSLNLCFSLVANAQNISYNQLKFKNHKAYYQNELFTGYAKVEHKTSISTLKFVDGLKQGWVISEHQMCNFRDNYVINFKYTDQNGKTILTMNIDSIRKDATDVELKLVFNGEKNDVISEYAIRGKQQIDFGIACIIQYNYDRYDTIRIPSFKFKSCTMSRSCKGFTLDLFPPIQKPAIAVSTILNLKENDCSLFMEDIIIIAPNGTELQPWYKKFYLQ